MSNRDLANKAAMEALRKIGGPQAVQELAQSLGSQAIGGVVHLIGKKIDWKTVSPCAAAVFHKTLVSTLPRWRWAARYHHQRLHLRWAAMCQAKDDCGLSG